MIEKTGSLTEENQEINLLAQRSRTLKGTRKCSWLEPACAFSPDIDVWGV